MPGSTVLPTPEVDEQPSATKKHKSDQATAFDILLGPDDDSDRDLTAGEELNQYFAEKAASHLTKPLQWWRDNAKRFPRVAVIAQNLLCIPATIRENIFKAGLTVSKLRTSLKPSNVDALIFQNKKLFKEVGMAVPKSMQTRIGMIQVQR